MKTSDSVERFGPLRKALRVVDALYSGRKLSTRDLQQLADCSPPHARRLKEFLVGEMDLGVEKNGREVRVFRRVHSSVMQPELVGVTALSLATAAMEVFRDCAIHDRWRELAAEAIERAGPDAQRLAQRLERAIHYVRGPHMDVRLVEPALSTLVSAIAERKCLGFTYRSSGEQGERRRSIAPWTLMIHDGLLYAVGEDRDDRVRKNWRLDRMSGVELLVDESYVLPPRLRFDPDALFTKSIGMWVDDTVPVENVQFTVFGKLVDYVSLTVLHPTEKKTLSQGVLSVSLRVQVTPELERWLLGLGDCCRVDGPPTLKDGITKRLASAVARYGLSTGPAHAAETVVVERT